ncbi:MAG TPA: FHA domain-containing protein, partial [Oscillospiraceae bacterium]|nr:FHA domain-containing protein [Oscillospiraceae bacterium]
MDVFFRIIRIALPLLGTIIISYSISSLLRLPARRPTGVYLKNITNGDLVELKFGENSIGRSKICDLIINYPTVSRLHAVISHSNGVWYVTDTHSSTGTKVNGNPFEGRQALNDM